MKVTLLGFTVPSDLMDQINAQDPVMQSQTHRFAWALVRALRTNGVRVNLLSVAPVSDFPRNRRVLWPRLRFEEDCVRGLLLPFVNMTGVKHVTRFVSCWVMGTHELRRLRPDWILVHGVHSPFLWFATMASRRLGGRAAAVLSDPPSVVRQEDGGVVAALKRIDKRLITAALRRMDAVVVLAEPLAADFAPNVPFLVMEGLFDPAAPGVASDEDRTATGVIVFAGGLHAEYGVANLVKAFRALEDADVSLELYGRGPLEPWLRQQAAQDRRIRAPRLVRPGELSAIYARAAVLVQPRQIEQGFVPYSFPSKLIEYMASGTVVISTRLPSIPAEYEPHVFWTVDDSPEALTEAMQRVLGWTTDQRREFGLAASTFVRLSRDTKSQGARIVRFLLADARS